LINYGWDLQGAQNVWNSRKLSKNNFSFPRRCIGSREPIQRVPLSPDLAQFDSTFWDQVKWNDYSVKTLTIAYLQQYTRACQYIT